MERATGRDHETARVGERGGGRREACRLHRSGSALDVGGADVECCRQAGPAPLADERIELGRGRHRPEQHQPRVAGAGRDRGERAGHDLDPRAGEIVDQALHSRARGRVEDAGEHDATGRGTRGVPVQCSRTGART